MSSLWVEVNESGVYVDKKVARCGICNVNVGCSNNITNLKQHIHLHHP